MLRLVWKQSAARVDAHVCWCYLAFVCRWLSVTTAAARHSSARRSLPPRPPPRYYLYSFHPTRRRDEPQDLQRPQLSWLHALTNPILVDAPNLGCKNSTFYLCRSTFSNLPGSFLLHHTCAVSLVRMQWNTKQFNFSLSFFTSQQRQEAF